MSPFVVAYLKDFAGCLDTLLNSTPFHILGIMECITPKNVIYEIYFDLQLVLFLIIQCVIYYRLKRKKNHY